MTTIWRKRWASTACRVCRFWRSVEQRFGVRISDDELIQLRTIRRIADTVQRLQGSGL